MFVKFWLLLILLLICAIFVIHYLIRFNRRKKRILKYVGHLQSPPELPIVGSGLLFLGKNTDEIMQACVNFMAQLITPFYAWFGGMLILVIDHPDDAHTVLTSKSCMEKAIVYKFFNMGTSLFTAPGKSILFYATCLWSKGLGILETLLRSSLSDVKSIHILVHVWKPQRKILNTAFNLKILQSFIPIFCEKVQHLVRNLREKEGDDAFDITPMVHACALEMVCATTLGSDIEAQNGKNAEYVEAIGNYLATVAKRVFNFFYHFEFIFKRTELYKQYRKNVEESERLPYKVIEEQKQAYFRANPMGTNNNQSSSDGYDDDIDYNTPQIFLHQLFRLYSKGIIDDRNIRDQVYLMIFAGNDTTSLTLSYAILLLAMHQSVQERAAAEADRVFNDLSTDEKLTYEHVTQFEYIEQILRETLRLNPVAPYILRHCMAETKIRDCIIPRDTIVIINLYTMQRRSDIWGSNANEFDPNRFHPNEMKKRNPNAFAPFSLGPRNCIGMRYAYIEMKIILATLLRNFRFTTHLKMSDIRMRYEITMKNIHGNMVCIERRI